MSPPSSTPPPATASPPAGQRRGGRCCLFGCGVVAALCLLVAVGVWWGYRELAQPWWDAKLDQWEERYPAVGWLRTARELWDFEAQARFDRIGGGMSEAAAFPDDVYLPPSPRRSASRVYEHEAVAVLVLVPQDLSQLAADYRREMAARGWLQSPAADPEGGVRLAFARNGRRATVTLVPRETATEVWVEAALPGSEATP